ncbi:MAG: DEAD/DEAH box helicase family protein [Pseudomonadota bacterium]
MLFTSTKITAARYEKKRLLLFKIVATEKQYNKARQNFENFFPNYFKNSAELEKKWVKQEKEEERKKTEQNKILAEKDRKKKLEEKKLKYATAKASDYFIIKELHNGMTENEFSSIAQIYEPKTHLRNSPQLQFYAKYCYTPPSGTDCSFSSSDMFKGKTNVFASLYNGLTYYIFSS